MARVGKVAVAEISGEDGREIYELCAESFGIGNQLNLLDPDCPGLDDADRLVRDYAVAVKGHPAQIPDVLFARLKEQFSDAQIVELTVRIGLAGFFNRLNDALEIEIEDGAQDAFQVATQTAA